ncbi:MAG: FAD-binding oxidoreductase [Nitrospirales bacterium]
MTWQTYKAKIESIRMLAPNISELVLTLLDPPVLRFQSGQAMAVTIPASFSEIPTRRYYSLVSPQSSARQICLLFDQGEQGVGSQFLRCQPVGAELILEGPFGTFGLQENFERDLLFVATGTGIAPIRSMIATLLENAMPRCITLLWGLRRECDVYYLDEFEAWASHYPQFSFVLTLTQAEAQWTGSRGRVTQVLEEMPHLEQFTAYVCGGRKMVKDVTALLYERGVVQVYRERHHDVL